MSKEMIPVPGGFMSKPSFAARETCVNGHPWKTATTRWRFRDRGGRHGSGWERDCLVCKRKQEGRRRRLRVADRRYM